MFIFVRKNTIKYHVDSRTGFQQNTDLQKVINHPWPQKVKKNTHTGGC